MLEQPALEVRLELPHHELRQPARLFGALEERRPVRAHHAVQHRVFGTTARIAVRARRVTVSSVSNGGGGHRASSDHLADSCSTGVAHRPHAHRLSHRRTGDERSGRALDERHPHVTLERRCARPRAWRRHGRRARHPADAATQGVAQPRGTVSADRLREVGALVDELEGLCASPT